MKRQKLKEKLKLKNLAIKAKLEQKLVQEREQMRLQELKIAAQEALRKKAQQDAIKKI